MTASPLPPPAAGLEREAYPDPDRLARERDPLPDRRTQVPAAPPRDGGRERR